MAAELEAAQIISLFKKAWLKRPADLRQHNLFRVVDGAGDGIPNLYVDKIGSFLLAHILETDSTKVLSIKSALGSAGAALTEIAAVSSLYMRVHGSKDLDKAILLHGSRVEQEIVSEHSLKFLVRPEANLNAGIFLDTREVRRLLLQISKGKSVLNTFCFTGSLGIAAHSGGAASVVQVDSSKSILRWARENFELNHAAHGAEMRFICDDCMSFMQREQRRIVQGKEAYDLLILDPPSFGKAGRKSFSIERDFEALLSQAFKILKSRAEIILCSNFRSYSKQSLRELGTSAAKANGIEIISVKDVSAPQTDFCAAPSHSIAMKGQYFEVRSGNRHV